MRLFLSFFKPSYSPVFLLFFWGFNSGYARTDSLDLIKNIIRQANDCFKRSDFVCASEKYFKALPLAEKIKDSLHISLCNTNIACVFNETEKYNESEKYAKRAIAVLEKMNYPEELGNAYNALAVCYYNSYKDSLALLYYNKALEQWKIIKDSLGLFSGYKNLGATYLEMGKTEMGLRTMEQCLKYLRANEKSDTRFSAYMTLGEAYIYNGNPEKGKLFLQEAEKYLPHLKGLNKLHDYHHAWYYYYKKKNDFFNALKQYELYKQYTDTILNKESSKQLQELNVKYETEKKEAQIELQQLKINQEQASRRQFVVIASSIIVLLILLFVSYRQYQKRKTEKLLRLQDEKNVRDIFEAEQKERIRIARDLHDSIGQKLSVIKMLLPKREGDKDLEKISEFLNETAAEVRNISHNLIPEILNFGLLKALEDMTDKINQSGKIKVEFTPEINLNDIKLSRQTELSLYRIIQEILNNIIKHAQTTGVSLTVKAIENFIQINIIDNGKGFELNAIEQSQGIGWKNIFARIKLINGKIDIHSEKNKGSQFLINVPIV